MRKLIEVHTLPTGKVILPGKLWSLTPTKKLYYLDGTSPGIHHHLYFTSDEDIIEGDWFIMNNCILRKCKKTNREHYTISRIVDTINGIHYKSVCRKVIATTNPELWVKKNDGTDPIRQKADYIWNVPKIATDFIEAFIKAKGNIRHVLVTYSVKVDALRNIRCDKPKLNNNNSVKVYSTKENKYENIND